MCQQCGTDQAKGAINIKEFIDKKEEDERKESIKSLRKQSEKLKW